MRPCCFRSRRVPTPCRCAAATVRRGRLCSRSTRCSERRRGPPIRANAFLLAPPRAVRLNFERPLPAVTAPATGAVFLSYASQDAAPARRICDALRAAGVEVWFDQSELDGGDAW